MAIRLLFVVALAVATAGPAFAQVDISGNWRPMARNEDGSGMTGDAAGLPITMSSRWRADSWSPEDFDVAEWVCRPHTWDYTLETILTQMRIWPEVDQATQQVIAIHGHINQEEQETTIWMDGRERPPAHALAAHRKLPAGDGAHIRSVKHVGAVYPQLDDVGE